MVKGILYFLKKYGNTSFKELPFNEIDSLILCQISYLNLDIFANPAAEKTYLKEILIPQNSVKLSFATMCHKKNEKLVKIFANTSRYDEIYFKDYINDLDLNSIKQFFAVTFFIDDFLFVSYRGTDLSIAGWEEDYNLSFCNEIPSQKDSINYLNFIYDTYHKKMYVGGHSKGGNLATYAVIYCKPEVLDLIEKIYSFDGPGFSSNEIFKEPQYLKIKDKLVTTSAVVSVIALLLYHVEDIQFLSASSITILQHASFNWKIKSNCEFKRVEKNSADSKLFSNIVEECMFEFSLEERKKFGNIFFYIAKEQPTSSLLDIKKHPLRFISQYNKRKKTLADEDLQFYKSIIRRVRKCIKKVLFKQISVKKVTKQKQTDISSS